MKVHVMVATTQGLVAIQKIYRQDPDIRSVVSINGTTTVSPISAAYHLFVTKGVGIIENHFGGASYRVNIASQIDQGNSWQLGFYLAHALESRGELGDGQPQAGDRVICASGELNTSELSVLAVKDIALKMERAAAQLSQWPDNLELQFILPKANGLIAPAALPANISQSQLHYVDSLAQALKVLPNKPSEPASLPATSQPQSKRHTTLLASYKVALVQGTVVVIIAVVLALYALGFLAPSPAWDLPESSATSAANAPDKLIAYDTLLPFASDTSQDEQQNVLRLGYSSTANCNNVQLSYQSYAAHNHAFAPAARAQLCDMRFYSQAAYTALIAINIHSHRFVQASQLAQEFVIPVPQHSATYLLLAFTSVLAPDTLKALHGYLFNLPEQHILSEAELKQLPFLAELKFDIFSHQLNPELELNPMGN